MTIIIACRDRDKVVIASDSLSTKGEFISHKPIKKLFKFKNFIVGFCGLSLLSSILASIKDDKKSFMKMKNAQDAQKFTQYVISKLEKHMELDGETRINSFIIVTPKHIFETDDYADVVEYDEYTCIGSGADFALGSLTTTDALYFEVEVNLHERVKMALEAALKFNKSCGGDLIYMELDR